MKRILIITFLILSSLYIIGIYQINSSQNQYLQPKTEKESDIILNNEISSSTPIATSTNKIVKKIADSIPKKKSPIIAKIPEEIPVPQIPPPPPEPIPDFEVINTFARKAIVNILCTAKNSELSPISGTGVIISPKGVVLTNAHVGQYFLLRDLYQKNFIECVLRTGSPAYPRYNVELAYISPVWVNQNKTLLKSQNPQGTGENDFALLRITNMVDGSNLPMEAGLLNFPFLEPNIREIITLNEPVILVSYPAGFLGGLFILKDLNITSSITLIRDFFTFKENTIDLISVPGTIVSQKGSSGGAMVDKNSTLIGIITTNSDGNTTSERNLSAITLGYINRNLKNETNITLYDFLSENLETFIKNFQENQVPALTKIIADELTKNN